MTQPYSHVSLIELPNIIPGRGVHLYNYFYGWACKNYMNIRSFEQIPKTLCAFEIMTFILCFPLRLFYSTSTVCYFFLFVTGIMISMLLHYYIRFFMPRYIVFVKSRPFYDHKDYTIMNDMVSQNQEMFLKDYTPENPKLLEMFANELESTFHKRYDDNNTIECIFSMINCPELCDLLAKKKENTEADKQNLKWMYTVSQFNALQGHLTTPVWVLNFFRKCYGLPVCE